MKIKLVFTLLAILILIQISSADAKVKISTFNGDVKIRRGIEETWQKAKTGILLEEIDTIVTGKKSTVSLELENGKIFVLEENSQLDISDLRTITEKEMMLFLMSRKINKIEPRSNKTPLRVGKVSVVHGESKNNSDQKVEPDLDKNTWEKETNGAKALFGHELYPNTIVKLNVILSKHPAAGDDYEIFYFLGKSFEAMNKNGQAEDAYKIVLKKSKETKQKSKIFEESKLALKRLKNK